MDRVGMFEAKTHFSELVDRVLREGQPITVTRRGVPVVEIVPVKDRLDNAMTREEAIEALAQLRREVPSMSRDEIVNLVAEGRRS